MELETTIQQRLHLKEVNSQSHRHRGAVLAPRRQGRIIVNSPHLMHRVGAVYIVHSPLPLRHSQTNKTDSTL
jgi:hypothetical protein